MKSRIFLILPLLLAFFMYSCKEDEKKEEKPVRQLNIVYAVNNSSLANYLPENERQILAGMADIDTDVYKLLLYKTNNNFGTLYEVARQNDGTVFFREIKKYTNDMLSTDPVRFGQVLNDALALYPDATPNLFLWGHGSGWYPEMTDHTRSSVIAETGDNPVPSPFYGIEVSSFGGEKNNGAIDWLDLKEMADAIPDNKFETIWFDCCFMSSIEVAYQLRNKCKYMMGCAAELMGEGTPYRVVLPKVMSMSPDWNGAVRSMCDYFKANNEVVTVALLNMDKIEPLAEAVKAILSNGNVMPQEANILNYSGREFATMAFTYKLYDFCQFIESYADINSANSLISDFNTSLNDFVIYKGCSERNFRGYAIDFSKYSGINTHIYRNSGSSIDKYYKDLDWYKRVYAK